MRHTIALVIFFTAIILSACIYRPDVQQGNIISQSCVNQLRIGMTEAQVKDILGTPLLIDTFRNNRLVYVYTFQHSNGVMSKRGVTVYFRKGKVTHILKK